MTMIKKRSPLVVPTRKKLQVIPLNRIFRNLITKKRSKKFQLNKKALCPHGIALFYLAYFLLNNIKLLTFFNVLLYKNKLITFITIHLIIYLLAIIIGTATFAKQNSCYN